MRRFGMGVMPTVKVRARKPIPPAGNGPRRLVRLPRLDRRQHIRILPRFHSARGDNRHV